MLYHSESSNNDYNIGNRTWSFLDIKLTFTPPLRKESRKSYDEYAKYDEASTKASKANGAKAG